MLVLASAMISKITVENSVKKSTSIPILLTPARSQPSVPTAYDVIRCYGNNLNTCNLIGQILETPPLFDELIAKYALGFFVITYRNVSLA